MDDEATRLEAIEQRLLHVERGLDELQQRLAVQGVSPSAPAPAPLLPPPPPGVHRAAARPIRVSPATSVRVQPVPQPAQPALARAMAASVPAAPSAPAPSAPAPSAWAMPTAAMPAAPTISPKPSMTLKDLEERFAGRALAWIGGGALIAAAVFFLSLAFSRGWITEPMRVLIGLAVGSAAFAGGAALLARRNALVGNVLAGVGLGILSIAIMAATRLYGLIPPELGLLMALVMAVVAAVVAIRFDARSVAALGLVAALAAPPLTGASASTLTLLFVAVTLVGTTGVALYRSWRWLPSLAFLLAAPQLASWLLDDPVPVQALIALAGFWTVNLVAAAGEEVRIRRDDLRPSSSILVLANATFLLWGLMVTLDGSLEAWRGIAIGLAALAHLLAGAWFLARQGWQHLFGNLVAGTSVALLAIAAFVQLGAPAVPIAWAAEATALAWLAARRVHRWSALAALALGSLAVLHLLLVEYPFWLFQLPSPERFVPALAHPEAASLGGVLVALVVAMAVVPVRWIRSALAASALLLVTYAAPFEVAGPVLALVLSASAVAGLVADRLLERTRTPARLTAVASWVTLPAASCGALVSGSMAILFLVAAELSPAGLGSPVATPFLNPGWLSLVIVLVGLAAAGALVAVRWVRSALGAIGLLLFGWGMLFQVQGTALVAILAVLLPVGVVLDTVLVRLPADARYPRLARVGGFTRSASVAGWIPWFAAALYTTARWPLVLELGLPAIPFTDERTLAVALLAASAIASTRWWDDVRVMRIAWLAAIGVTAWLVPSEVGASGVVILWVVLAGVALWRQGRDRPEVLVFAGTALLLWAGALGVGLVVVAPPVHLYVSADPDALPALWMAAFAMLAAGSLLASRDPIAARVRPALATGAGLITLYAVSVAVVDVFARRVGEGVPGEELAKQAQVALSVCWTAIGVSLLAIGLARRRAVLRHAGLALLAVAIAKVVLIDMASMDVAYRALVLFGLGLLLLAGAWLLTRFRGPRAGSSSSTASVRPA